IREDLTAFFTDLAAFLATPTGRALARITLVQPDDTRFEELLEQFRAARLDRAGAVIHRGIDRGELPRETDAELLLEALTGSLHFRVLERNLPADLDYVRRLVDLLLAGVRSTTPPAERV
ncbi:TetR-like C-terminal domain-containing protein, partial [Amycolatopsis sp. NPDC023774]|uniref:TetR-like C-terminal domain-containing protein n=1 Tax=Amycolatopsis sp. NPDC023774 TaxID=3155015 RepID=UPI0033FDB32F